MSSSRGKKPDVQPCGGRSRRDQEQQEGEAESDDDKCVEQAAGPGLEHRQAWSAYQPQGLVLPFAFVDFSFCGRSGQGVVSDGCVVALQ